MTLAELARDALQWIKDRSEGGVLPRTFSRGLQERIGAIWRSSRSEPLTEDQADGMRRLGDVFGWDIGNDIIFETSGVKRSEFCPPLGGDWDRHPKALGAVCNSLSLIAKLPAKTDTKTDTEKKREKKNRPLSKEAAACIRIYNRGIKAGDRIPMKRVIEDYVAEHGGSISSIDKTVRQHKHLKKKPDTKRTKS